jgi:hypothetical protein
MAPENDMRTRAKDHLPSVLLTLLSIMQALALELLWDHIHEHTYLNHMSWAAVLGWVEIGVTLLGVLLIWLIYTSMAMRFRWVPTTADSVFPFLVGIIEFMMIAALGVDRLGLWFMALALIFGAMTWVSQVTMLRARLDGENHAFFASVSPATPRDFVPSIATVTVLAGLGIYLLLSRDQGWFALVALLIAATALAVQFWLNDRYWRRSMGLP